MSKLKQRAAKLLRQYDDAKRKLREMERELDAACLAYGDELRMSFLTPDKFRTILLVEQEQKAKLNQIADRTEWERSHG